MAQQVLAQAKRDVARIVKGIQQVEAALAAWDTPEFYYQATGALYELQDIRRLAKGIMTDIRGLRRWASSK